jgi:multiple sugar transport system substrate-binding protein
MRSFTSSRPALTRAAMIRSAACAAVAALAQACAGRGGSGASTGAEQPRQLTKERITLTWAMPGGGGSAEEDTYKAAAAKFSERYPNITVEQAPSGRSEQLARVAGGRPDDLMFSTINDAASWIEQGVFLGLDALIRRDKFDIDDFFPEILKPYRYDGKGYGQGDLYGLPKEIAVRAMYYNKTIFDKEGIKPPPPDRPWDWNEFLQMTRQVTKREGDTVTQWGYVQEDWWGMWMIWAWSNGGEAVDDPYRPTRSTMTQPQVVEALQFWADFQARLRVAPNADDLKAMNANSKVAAFAMGRVATYNNGRWNVPLLRQVRDFEWDVMPMPVSPTTKQRAQLLTGSIFAVAAGSKYREETWELLKFAMGKEGMTFLTDLGVLQPSRKSVAQSDVFMKKTPPVNNRIFFDEVPFARVLPIHPFYGDMANEIDTRVRNEVLRGTKSAKQAIEEFTPLVDQILKKTIK